MYNGTEFFDTDAFDPEDEGDEAACCVCGNLITAEEWDERHEMHEEYCLHETDYEKWEEVGCYCDLQAHPECCTQCRDDEEE